MWIEWRVDGATTRTKYVFASFTTFGDGSDGLFVAPIGGGDTLQAATTSTASVSTPEMHAIGLDAFPRVDSSGPARDMPV